MNSLVRGSSPEAKAHELLERGCQRSPAVDIVAIANLWPELQLVEEDLERAGYLLRISRSLTEIVVRREDPPARKRFTIAHELGHVALAGFSGVQSLSCGRAEVERWCDAFAAALLMPREWILRDLAHAGVEGLLECLQSGPGRYGTSLDAFFHRVTEVSPISVLQTHRHGPAVSVENEWWAPDSSKLRSRVLQYVVEHLLPSVSHTSKFGNPALGLDGYVAKQRAARAADRWVVIVFPSEWRPFVTVL
jgi:Zn-dependent peptidase ImmA (M78 family)